MSGRPKSYGQDHAWSNTEKGNDVVRDTFAACDANQQVPTYAMTLRTCAEIFRQINCYLFCRNLQRGPGCGVPPETLKENLKKGFECLKEGLDILDREPEGSFEKKIVEGSKDSITQLDDWVKMVCSSL